MWREKLLIGGRESWLATNVRHYYDHPDMRIPFKFDN